MGDVDSRWKSWESKYQPIKAILRIIKNNILVIIALYLILTNGLLTLIFASSLGSKGLNSEDIGKYVEVRGKLVKIHEENILPFSNKILLISYGDSLFIAEYRGIIPDNVYNLNYFTDYIGVSGKVEQLNERDASNLPFVLNDGAEGVYLKIHFLNNHPNAIFKYSAIFLLFFGLLHLKRRFIR